jgi:hypothetical protein
VKPLTLKSATTGSETEQWIEAIMKEINISLFCKIWKKVIKK